jgi:sugar phosphate isomerase/epimerase
MRKIQELNLRLQGPAQDVRNPMTTRRQLLLASVFVPALWAKRHRIDRSRISAISDEIARTPAEAIAFAKQYGLQWLELRDMPGAKGQLYCELPEQELQMAAKELREGGVRISLLGAELLKFGLPGTVPLMAARDESAEAREKRQAQETKRFDSRMDDLAKAIRAAHVLGTDKVRVFAFRRVAEPQTVLPRIADILGEMTKMAERERIRLLLENEASCNVATCAELATILKMIPSRALGLNWDALNGRSRNETPFPNGYALLPKKRIGNVHVKGRSILTQYKDTHLDWASIFRALERDGYQGEISLETHISEGRIENSHASMKEILRLVSAL